MSILAPVSAAMRLITLPPGPMTVPIFSGSMWMMVIFGACSDTCSRGSPIASTITPRIRSRASRARSKTVSSRSPGSFFSLVSSWIAVTPRSVPATLKSMSPNASSMPAMSVSTRYPSPSSSLISPIATPATGAEIGTPASISASVDPHTAAIEVEPFDISASETTRTVYGNSSNDGSTGSNARSASSPWPISRRPGPRRKRASPTEYGGKL